MRMQRVKVACMRRGRVAATASASLYLRYVDFMLLDLSFTFVDFSYRLPSAADVTASAE